MIRIILSPFIRLKSLSRVIRIQLFEMTIDAISISRSFIIFCDCSRSYFIFPKINDDFIVVLHNLNGTSFFIVSFMSFPSLSVP